MSSFPTLFWVALPYASFIAFLVGMYWRYHYDAYGWTTRSSQMYESRLLRIGSPLFHVGILMALAGHVVGLLVPEAWTTALGVSEQAYHVGAVAMGVVAAAMVVTGLAILIYRRRTQARVFGVTTRMDKLMYVLLAGVVLLGVFNTVGVNLLDIGGGHPGGYNYRESVAVWFRSIVFLNPQPDLMAEAPWSFQLHAVLAMVLFAVVPFTRLVHIFSVPVGYVARPYIVYRSRDPRNQGNRDPRRGWEPVRRP
ncbi:MAG: respiratory nitrate reductase subunit gamma [Frankiales bacterium]|nr:respiratory nitrate reductase subunit gamma [Frankiales bacterium]